MSTTTQPGPLKVRLSDQLGHCNRSEMMFESFTIQHPYRAGTMEVVPAADYATAKLEALDCRTCRHLSTKHQECLSELRCEGGDQHQRQGKLMLWYTADLQGRGF